MSAVPRRPKLEPRTWIGDLRHSGWLQRAHEWLVEPESGRGRRRRGRYPRRIVRIAIAAAALAILTPLALWAHYRMTYVVSINALVKGHITEIGAQLDGVVTNVEVDAGEQVKAGQVLARFEDHQLEATTARARS